LTELCPNKTSERQLSFLTERTGNAKMGFKKKGNLVTGFLMATGSGVTGPAWTGATCRAPSPSGYRRTGVWLWVGDGLRDESTIFDMPVRPGSVSPSWGVHRRSGNGLSAKEREKNGRLLLFFLRSPVPVPALCGVLENPQGGEISKNLNRRFLEDLKIGLGSKGTLEG